MRHLTAILIMMYCVTAGASRQAGETMTISCLNHHNNSVFYYYLNDDNARRLPSGEVVLDVVVYNHPSMVKGRAITIRNADYTYLTCFQVKLTKKVD